MKVIKHCPSFARSTLLTMKSLPTQGILYGHFSKPLWRRCIYCRVALLSERIAFPCLLFLLFESYGHTDVLDLEPVDAIQH